MSTTALCVAHDFPLAALVGQEQLKSALLLCAVNPGIGGVLIRGEKGSAKSTAARGLAGVMAPIQRVAGCAYNCAPAEPAPGCEVCNGEARSLETRAVPFVNLPLGASEDRVLGSLDFERALKDGRKAFQPGLLASAHRGILYIDEVNLLPDHLVDVLLDVAAMGINRVQREGLSVQHAARIALVGTMNQEEGELRPQLLDRFGMMVEVRAPLEPRVRTEIVRRRLAWEADAADFNRVWYAQQVALREQVLRAQELLAKVNIAEGLLVLISELCCSQGVASLRADLVMNKAARALAALRGRTRVEPDDISEAAMLVLPHRRRTRPFEQPGLDEEQLQRFMEKARSGGGLSDSDSQPGEGGSASSGAYGPSANSGSVGDRASATGGRRASRGADRDADRGADHEADRRADHEADRGAGREAHRGAGREAHRGAGREAHRGAGREADGGAGREADRGAGREVDRGAGREADRGVDREIGSEVGRGDDNKGGHSAGAAEDRVYAAGTSGALPRIELKSAAVAGGVVGRRSSAVQARHGREVRAVPDERPTELAVTATLHHSVLRNGGLAPDGRLEVTRADLHQKVKAGRQGSLILFVVDASGSMAALQRMEAVKGTVLALLRDAYQRRDEVGVIAFRGTEAKVLLPPTRSVDAAERQLRELPTGGRTPLAHALHLAGQVLTRSADMSRGEPLLIVLSDGRANVGLDERTEPREPTSIKQVGPRPSRLQRQREPREQHDPWRQSLDCARVLAEKGLAALVLDTEVGFVRMGRARELADVLGAQCLALEDLSTTSLTLTIRSRLQATRQRVPGQRI